MNCLFSITIPAYKDTFLKECIDSVLSQTYTYFEIVIVNDASPYDIDSIIQSYDDKRIRYYKNEKNYGAVNVVYNWNKCLEYAKGNYIICMGDDDILLPNCLEDYYSLISKYPGLGVYHAWTEIIDEHSKFKMITAASCEFESVYSLLWHRWNCRRRQFIGDFLFDAELLRDNGGFKYFPLAWGSDEISATIAAIPYGIANTQTICFAYRENSQTISKTGDAELKLKATCEVEKWCENFLEFEPEDKLDKKYWICLCEQKNKYFNREKALEVAIDLREHFFLGFWKWFRKRQLYGLSNRILFFAFFESLKQRLSTINKTPMDFKISSKKT